MTTAMTTGTTPGQPGTITASAIAAIETVVRERQNLVDEWRMRSDNSLPPRECVFTAYNITKEVQSKHQQWAPHAQVRDIVHDTISRIMSMDECLIDIPGVTTKPGVERPRLYHPPEISHQVAEQIFSNYGHVNVNVQFVPVERPRGRRREVSTLPARTQRLHRRRHTRRAGVDHRYAWHRRQAAGRHVHRR
jgi:hypothetical protein